MDISEQFDYIRDNSKSFVVLSGPSGSGKTMVTDYLRDTYNFCVPPFVTTRTLRAGEEEIGAKSVSPEAFLRSVTKGEIFLGVRNYGNAYGYYTQDICKLLDQGAHVVIEAPASCLMTDVVVALPESTIIGIVPLKKDGLEQQLTNRGIHKAEDQRIRLLSAEIEKEHIAYCCGLIEITPVLPTDGSPEYTLRQIDRIMKQRGFDQGVGGCVGGKIPDLDDTKSVLIKSSVAESEA